MLGEMAEGILDSRPRIYRFFYQLKDNSNILFGCMKRLAEFSSKVSYRAKFKDSSVYLNIKPGDPRCNIRIGRHSISSSIIRAEWVPSEGHKYSIHIGSFTHISNNLKIILSKAHTLDAVSNNLNSLFLDRRGIVMYRKHHKEEYGNVSIGNDVWIGDDVIIIGSVSIGDGAVIGARSIVTSNVEPYAIVGGAPARLIRYRLDKSIIAKLLKIKWWNWSDEQILSNMESFYDPEKFVRKNWQDKP